jgi:hypothetical protein
MINYSYYEYAEQSPLYSYGLSSFSLEKLVKRPNLFVNDFYNFDNGIDKIVDRDFYCRIRRFISVPDAIESHPDIIPFVNEYCSTPRNVKQLGGIIFTNFDFAFKESIGLTVHLLDIPTEIEKKIINSVIIYIDININTTECENIYFKLKKRKKELMKRLNLIDKIIIKQ